ncbi:MAG: hypothetical protein HWD61_13350 [Parachlamydiaceae bacterium]|nr:MAG: hypothetical protein HWD61_13350 [Parachlamydiaceae bacterium]
MLLQNVETNDAPFLASLAKIFKVEGKGSLVNYLTSSILDESIPEDVQVACISKFPCSILTQHVLPTLELTEEFNPIHIKILAKLHVEEGTATSSPIHLNWSKISKWYQPDSTSIVPIEDLLPYLISYQKITEFCFPLLIAKYHHDKAKSEQEKRALESAVNDAKSKGRIKLKPSNTDEDETNEAYYQALFTHLEKEPWKALMLINSDIPELSAQPNKEQLVKDFYRSITIWLEKQKDGEGSPLFPACLEIFQKVGPLEKQTKLTARTQVFEGPKKLILLKLRIRFWPM